MSKIKPTMRGGVPRCSRTECPMFELHNAALRSGMCLVNEVSFGPDDGDVCEPAVIADRRELAAWKAVGGWLKGPADEPGYGRTIDRTGSRGRFVAGERCGVSFYPVASAKTIPSLAAALASGREDTDADE